MQRNAFEGRYGQDGAERQRQQAGAERGRALALRWIMLAVVYFVVGVFLGIGMAVAHDFTLKPVHVHVNLLGWVSMALFAGVYGWLPHLAANRLALTHFWAYNLALPLGMGALAAVLGGYEAFEPLLPLTSLALGIAVLAFAVNVLMHARVTPATNATPNASAALGTIHRAR